MQLGSLEGMLLSDARQTPSPGCTVKCCMMQEWNEALLANDDYWDQNAFNDLMNRGAKFDEPRSDRLFM